MTEKSKYEQLAAIDVSAHIEKKQNLSYLSWAWAVDQLLRADPAANWSYSEPMRFPDDTVMVLCTVTAFGKSMTMQLPVMDFRNKAVKNPDAFAINTAMMRCLVKAIALHGLGLYIYAGEDLPLSDDEPNHEPQEKQKPEKLERKTMSLTDLKRYSTDKVDADGVVIKLSAKSLIEKQEESAKNLIDFLAAKYILPEAVIKEIQSWERGDLQ